MKKNKPLGIVYTVTHIPSGKKYVGVTTKSIENRKKDHLQKAQKGSGHYFHSAIAKYGPEAFIWEMVDSASEMDELAKKEREYIAKYESLNTGFNSDRGGTLKKTVYQYNTQNGKLIDSYPSLDCAARAVKADKKAISRACLNVNKIYSGFFWSYEFKETFVPDPDKRRKMVLQMDANGNVLAKYKSVAEASRQTGNSKSAIAKTCRNEQEQTGGYFWKYLQIKNEVELVKYNGNGNK